MFPNFSSLLTVVKELCIGAKAITASMHNTRGTPVIAQVNVYTCALAGIYSRPKVVKGVVIIFAK
jgi:hypothetical protein